MEEYIAMVTLTRTKNTKSNLRGVYDPEAEDIEGVKN